MKDVSKSEIRVILNTACLTIWVQLVITGVGGISEYFSTCL